MNKLSELKNLKLLILMCAFISACSVAPVAVESADGSPGGSVGASAAEERRHTPGPEQGGYNEPAEPSPESTGSASEAIQREAERQFKQGNCLFAVQLAERGLRIDRHNARLYLLLARCYAELGNGERSRQFASQGLSYAPAEEWTLRKELQTLAKSRSD